MAVASSLIDDLHKAGIPVCDRAVVEPLAGGVSCDVWLVDTEIGQIVVKRPLEKLRVAASWHAPVERGESEVRWLKRARTIDPAMAPEVCAELPGHGFAMRFIPDAPVWKDELVSGRVDPQFAGLVGSRIAQVHAATAQNADDRAAFANQAMFHALRIDPFLLHVSRNDAELADELRDQANALETHKTALVHGDVSPKNILVTNDGPVFIDAECAVYGDPAFDLAFCITHLLLKTVWLDDPRMQEAARRMVAAYSDKIDWEPVEPFDLRTGRYTAGLLLARIEGKSPAPYLTAPENIRIVREQARTLLKTPAAISQLVDHWQRNLA